MATWAAVCFGRIGLGEVRGGLTLIRVRGPGFAGARVRMEDASIRPFSNPKLWGFQTPRVESPGSFHESTDTRSRAASSSSSDHGPRVEGQRPSAVERCRALPTTFWIGPHDHAACTCAQVAHAEEMDPAAAQDGAAAEDRAEPPAAPQVEHGIEFSALALTSRQMNDLLRQLNEMGAFGVRDQSWAAGVLHGRRASRATCCAPCLAPGLAPNPCPYTPLTHNGHKSASSSASNVSQPRACLQQAHAHTCIPRPTPPQAPTSTSRCPASWCAATSRRASRPCCSASAASTCPGAPHVCPPAAVLHNT